MTKSVFDPLAQFYDVESKIVASLERLASVFRVILWNENKKYDLSPIQLQFLVFLLFHSPEKRTVTELAKEFNLTKATVSDAVSSLETKTLVIRQKENIDQRILTLSLTPKGRKIAKEASLFGNIIKDEVARLDHEQKVHLMKSLMDIIHGLQQKGIISVQRMCLTCRFFQETPEDKEPFYCNLMKKPLKYETLRIDCPEHEEKTLSVKTKF